MLKTKRSYTSLSFLLYKPYLYNRYFLNVDNRKYGMKLLVRLCSPGGITYEKVFWKVSEEI